jgi:flagellar hook protein FlgE
MLSSLFTGVSGMNANSDAMAVIGDNIANVNTTGYKSSRVSFSNILSKSLTGFSANEIGRGVTMSGISSVMDQGSLETTDNGTDLAIHGSGFFIVRDEEGISSYTRAGEFKFDKKGQLVDPNGLVVQGWDLDTASALGTGGATVDISIPGSGTSSPMETGEFGLELNLDAAATTGSVFSNTLTVYDSLGNDVELTLQFTRTANAREWSWSASVPAAVGSITNPVPAPTITFEPDGSLSNGADPSITIDLTNGAGSGGSSTQTITWNMYDATGVTKGDVTGYASPSSITYQTQNGYSAGMLQSVGIDEVGIISGIYTNGTIKPLFQIALADFPSYTGLKKAGGNLYMESLASGQPMMGVAGTGSLGGIIPNTLEMSNVDLASEFVKMITTQRAFQANSRVITSSDEILTELINLKR